MKVTKSSDALIDMIIKSEGLKLKSYRCPANVWTIGVGCTYYENGTRVKEGEEITRERAIELLKNVLKKYEADVDNMTRDDINQNQFDALVDFAFNCGSANLKSSTLLKKVNANPNDPNIAQEFNKWVRGGGKVLPGLVTRRKEEVALYFKK